MFLSVSNVTMFLGVMVYELIISIIQSLRRAPTVVSNYWNEYESDQFKQNIVDILPGKFISFENLLK